MIKSVIKSVVGNTGNAITGKAPGSWSSYCTPLNLVLAEITGGVRLTWGQTAQCTNEDGFEIWISIDGAAYALLDTVAADVLTYDDMTDYAGSTVDYKVRAYRGTAYSEYSDEESITIAATITNLAASWVNDFARLTWTGTAGWQTELYESTDNVNWTLVTTIAAGTATYDNYTWQGIVMYFRARAKNGALYGNYCSSINITTPLVYKIDANPTINFSPGGAFNLPAGKTVNINWGDGHNTNYVTTGAPNHNYGICGGSGAADPMYIQMSGDLNSITQLFITGNVLFYGNLSKWVIPSAMYYIKLNACAFTGDLSSWSLPATCQLCYLSTNQFTGIPTGHLEQLEGSTAGMSMGSNNCNTAAIDSWLAYAHAYLHTAPPVRNAYWYLANSPMGIPTGGNSNTDLVACRAIYVAAGFTLNATVRTS